MDDATWKKKSAAFAMVAALVGIIVLAFTMFSGGFTKSTPVVVIADRAGLVMEPNAKVKLRGVEVGRVKSIEYQDGGAKLQLAMNPDLLQYIPANAEVEIRTTTVFGAKYVDFIVPNAPTSEHLQANAVVASDSVTVEFNSIFEHLSEVLQKVQPEKLNATLGAISTALNGRGEQLGQLLEDGDSYLSQINPTLPQLQSDLAKAADVTQLYADTAPNLLRTVDNATGVSRTIVDQKQNLDAVLLGVTGLGGTANDVLSQNSDNLIATLGLLRPTTALLSEYSPEFSCFIRGLNDLRPLGETIFGGGQAGIALNSSFMYGRTAYQYPQDLPKVNATGGPNCAGLDKPLTAEHAPFVVADTGTVPFVPSTKMQTNMPKLFQLIYAGIYPEAGQ